MSPRKPAKANENTGSQLPKQVLIRVSEEEYVAWLDASRSTGMPVSSLIRRVMGHALGNSDVVEEVDRRIVEARINRAHHARQFQARPGSDVAPDAPVSARRAS
jgi:hypothetical protein